MGLWSNIYMDDISWLIFLFVTNPKDQNHPKMENIYTSDYSFGWFLLAGNTESKNRQKIDIYSLLIQSVKNKFSKA